ncbi:HlyD family secretion protein [Paraburkholderia antibiotica]|uniref:HlyD family efflux transporter periplasmic adaptor subunit n=1 Tax=Paraburkholderia antibiotica TaxID=2728839 RepID=A0A7X9X1X2_9BURK|nr:HlyD family efflux transporter periplasmic adaptor subunit [Paraburkholderia antibiotica]NML29910.1 HlyD family efflux transporter periplasmic adaptor subunit [Paraburkholderia antibiotica]
MESNQLPQFKDVPWRWIAYVTSALVIIAIAFAFLHEIELKQDVQSEIVSPAEVKIQGLSGLVSAIYVQPSEHVKAGEPLFQLKRDLSLASNGVQRPVYDERMRDDQLRTSEAQYAQRRSSLSAQIAAAAQTLQSRHAEMAALGEQITQNRALVDESDRKLARLKSVSDYVTADRIEQASADVHQGKVVVAQGLARQQQLLGDVATLQSSQTDLQAQLKELDAQHARDLQDIRLRFEQLRQDATISAPQAGVVTFSNLVPGRSLAADDVALVIGTREGGPLRAALRIPSRQRGFVREGDVVRLKFDAFPYERFGTYEARIDSISGTTVQTQISPDSASDAKASEGGDYMAWATLAGDTFVFEQHRFKILPGMRATASIVVERRTIAEWVLAPLFRMLRG